MIISLNWLKSFLPKLSLSVNEIERKLTLLGIEVEKIETRGGNLDGVVVGKIITCVKHPNAEKLSICGVDVGLNNNQFLTIVCGASNVAVGQIVPVALVGTELTFKSGEKIKLKKAKIRGEISEGMICAEDELGLSDNHDGIMILPNHYEVGQPLSAYIQSDTIFEISMTPNRPDVLSHLGVARELMGIHAVKMPDTQSLNFVPSEKVVVQDLEGCPLYTAVIIEGFEVKPSPVWLQTLLKNVGLRPINNIVDITNYVLLSIGQPLHAFDLDSLSEERILVRSDITSHFVTLDGKTRVIHPEMVMICDATKPVAIGGVMGGENSEITSSTKRLLLEAAYFNPSKIRKAAKITGISSDSSYRFERGTDPKNVQYAAQFASRLILEIAGGTIVGAYESNALKNSDTIIEFPFSRVQELLGVNIDVNLSLQLLNHNGFSAELLHNQHLRVTVPSYRVDIFQEADIIEEIARLYGYDQITPAPYLKASFPQSRDLSTLFERNLREIMVGFGFKEVLTNPLLKEEEAKLFSDFYVKTLNPISEEMAAMRPSLIPSLLKIVQHNLNRGNKNLRLFELAHVFENEDNFTSASLVKGYRENSALAFLITGESKIQNWDSQSGEVDFFDLKGVVEAFLRKLRLLEKATFIPYTANALQLKLIREGQLNFEDNFGRLYRIESDILKRYDIDQPVFIALFDVDLLQRFSDLKRHYQEPSKFPAVIRDLAFFFPRETKSEEILRKIREANESIEDVSIFDVYEDEKTLMNNKKSIAFSIKVVSYLNTLTDEAVNQVTEKVVELVCKEFNAELRS
ncbi:MAG: phenylalanine--tRNA ligase subunit beta [Chloroherpetonaceae bacterium]|nr:phenylalanine--tRNA ligase subunit beta [Chloroherpetonaceae bacterium]